GGGFKGTGGRLKTSDSTHPRAAARCPHRIKNRRPSSTACCQSAASIWSGQRRSKAARDDTRGEKTASSSTLTLWTLLTLCLPEVEVSFATTCAVETVSTLSRVSPVNERKREAQS